MAEHPAGHLVLKWLIEQDAKMKETEREGTEHQTFDYKLATKLAQ